MVCTARLFRLACWPAFRLTVSDQIKGRAGAGAISGVDDVSQRLHLPRHARPLEFHSVQSYLHEWQILLVSGPVGRRDGDRGCAVGLGLARRRLDPTFSDLRQQSQLLQNTAASWPTTEQNTGLYV